MRLFRPDKQVPGIISVALALQHVLRIRRVRLIHTHDQRASADINCDDPPSGLLSLTPRPLSSWLKKYRPCYGLCELQLQLQFQIQLHLYRTRLDFWTLIASQEVAYQIPDHIHIYLHTPNPPVHTCSDVSYARPPVPSHTHTAVRTPAPRSSAHFDLFLAAACSQATW